jgi:hypothetical protein
MKWRSVLFSGLDGKLGEQIVGAKWKGRNYFRSYITPANPRTNKQQAGRAVMKELVARYQAEMMTDDAAKAAWNKQGLPDLIPGFNLFCRQGRLSSISCPATYGAANVPITYTCGIPIQDAGLLSRKGSTWTIQRQKGKLSPGKDQTLNTEDLEPGTYDFFLANLSVLKPTEESPKSYQAVTKWKPDFETGTAVAAQVEVTSE